MKLAPLVLKPAAPPPSVVFFAIQVLTAGALEGAAKALRAQFDERTVVLEAA